ncbi:MAG: PAS domain S-box protein [Desulfomonile tiedjei]|nr:PAS domain S-box protein [Desulfomonile tiedjei]
MNDQDKTKEQLLHEVRELRKAVAQLEAHEIRHAEVPGFAGYSGTLFRKLTEGSVVGVYLIQDDLFRYVNPTLANIFGYQVNELLNVLGPKDLVFPEDWPMMDQNLRLRLSGALEAAHLQFRGLKKDGRIIQVEVHGSRTDFHEKPAVIGTLLDITGRIQAGQDLETELNKFQALYDLAVAMTAERSLDENLLLVVEKSRELLGADKSFMALHDEKAGHLRMHATSGVVTEDFKQLRIPIGVGMGGKVALTGKLRVVEDYFQEIGPVFHDVVRAEGLLSGIAVPVNIGANNLGVLYVFNRTKTPFSPSDLDTLSLLGNLAALEINRKSSEERLRESEDRYRSLYEASKRGEELYVSLLNSSADAIVIYDLEGRAKYVNRSFTRIFGWSLEDVEGRRIPFMPDSEREATMTIIQGLVRDGTPTVGFETRRFTKDSRMLDMSISASRYRDHEGIPAGTLVILRDITDRKQAEARLRESEVMYRLLYEESTRREELYRSVLNSSADAIVIYDMEGRAQYVSPSFTAIFGWTIEDVEGKRIPFMPESEREASMTIIYDIIRNGDSCSAFETKRFTKDGRTLDISISASRYHDHDGNASGILAILRNITDRKRAEQALRESEERFRTLAEVAPFGLVVIRADETAEYLNPKFTEIFGYTLEDVPDTDTWFLRAYPNKSRRVAAASIWRAEKAGIEVRDDAGAEAIPRTFSVRAKDGAEKIVDFRAVVLADGRILAAFLDITAQAKAQQEIVRAKNEWERTFNAVSDLVVILDSQHNVARANKALADRLGVAPEDVVGMSCRDKMPYQKTPAALCLDPEILADGLEHSAEISDEILGGVFDLRVSPLRDEQGKVFGSVHVARDITAVKSIERSRRRAVHHLSHELKTPLAIMKASVKNLADPNLSRAGNESNLQRIRRSLQRLNEIQEIVQEIVEPREYRPRPFPVTATVHQILDDIRSKIAHRSVALISRLETVNSDSIDPDLLQKVLDTLVKNSVENTPDGGEVVVSLSQAPAGVLLQVEDSGVGIAPSDREFLFRAFHTTQDEEQYATRNPFDFDAGGKGLELMRLKILSEDGHFDISFDSRRCRHLPTDKDHCSGSLSSCRYVNGPEDCKQAGGTVFSVLFRGGLAKRHSMNEQ